MVCIAPGDPATPLFGTVPPWDARPLEMMGDSALLSARRKIALISSARIPGEVILLTYDFFRKRRSNGPAFVSGFHSPMERQCLELLVVRQVPVVVCPARSLRRMRIPRGWRPALHDGRMLILSGFVGAIRRPTASLAEERNLLVASIADEVLIPFASPGGKTEMLVRRLLVAGVPVLTFAHSGAGYLVNLGARLVDERVEAAQEEEGRENGSPAGRAGRL